MSALKGQAASVTRQTVHEDDRLEFLPRHVGAYVSAFETAIYRLLGSMCKDYSGAYWEFYELDNGGWYLAPKLDGLLHLSVETNGYSGAMSADAAGIVTSLTVQNHLIWVLHERDPNNPLALTLNAAFYALRDYAAEHPEATAIFGAID